jgi:hypothetical protein
MRHASRTAVLALLAFGVAASVAAPAQADGALDKVTTHLYYHETGAVDDREASALTLWNTIVGEGDATGPSSAIFVRATVSGAETLTAGAVELVVSAGKKRLSRQRVSLDAYAATRGQPMTVPFVLYGTGCESLAVKVTLLAGKKTVATRQLVLPFSCGE